MILPAKHIQVERSLAGIGADILRALDRPKTVSETWTIVKARRIEHSEPLTFDWFILSLSWLYAVSAIRLENENLYRQAGK